METDGNLHTTGNNEFTTFLTNQENVVYQNLGNNNKSKAKAKNVRMNTENFTTAPNSIDNNTLLNSIRYNKRNLNVSRKILYFKLITR